MIPSAIGVWLHRHRFAFVGGNGVAIVLFAGAAAAFPGPFWALFGVATDGSVLPRLAAWYLGLFGAAGVVVARRPERHPAVVLLMGIEKAGPVAGFVAHQLAHGGHPLLAAVTGLDVVTGLLLLAYGGWLVRGGPGSTR